MFEVTVFLKQSYSGYAKSGLDSPLLFTKVSVLQDSE